MPLSVKKSNNIFIDSSIAFYCAANVGYRWAVKVMYLIAAGKIRGITDTFVCQEILERFFSSEEPGKGELLCSCFRQIIQVMLPVTEEDFILSCELRKKYPNVNPRILLRAAVMINNAQQEICSTFASGIENISELERVNLLEKFGEIERISD